MFHGLFRLKRLRNDVLRLKFFKILLWCCGPRKREDTDTEKSFRERVLLFKMEISFSMNCFLNFGKLKVTGWSKFLCKALNHTKAEIILKKNSKEILKNMFSDREYPTTYRRFSKNEFMKGL